MVLFMSKSKEELEPKYAIKIKKTFKSKPELFKESGVIQEFVTKENAESIAIKIAKAYGFFLTKVVEID